MSEPTPETTQWCGHFSMDIDGNCMRCASEAERRADMAQAFNEGVIAQREATRAAGGSVGQIASENPYRDVRSSPGSAGAS